MPSMWLEIRQAARRLLASPGYSAGAFILLTLGLALSVGMYTVLAGVVLNGLPYPGGERVVEIRAVNAEQGVTEGRLTVAEGVAPDPGIIGRQLTLESGSVTVVGVMPPEFTHPAPIVGMWRAADEPSFSRDPALFLDARYPGAVGRLADGLDAEGTARSLDAFAAGLRERYELADEGWRLRTVSLLEQAIGDVRGVLAGVFVVALVVLAIACANVGSLLAARLAVRERELAIVQALGATAARVWRGVFFELLLLASLAAAVASLLVLFGVDVFRTLAADTLPRADEIAFDPAVAAFAACLALLCPALVAAPFALRLRRRMGTSLNAGKGQVSAPGGALRALPVAGLALATSALIAGTAVILSFDRLRAVDPGIRADDLYGVQVYHGSDADEQRRFAREVLARIAAEPDVTAVAMTSLPPLADDVGNFVVDVQVPGRDRTEPLQVLLQRVSPEYPDVVGQPVKHGRGFTSGDDAAAPNVALVNETFARRVFGDADPIGREIALAPGPGPRIPFRIVGVTADMHNQGLRSAPAPEVLLPYMQAPWVGMTFLAYAPQASAGLLERMQEAVWAVDPREAITRVAPVSEDLRGYFAQPMFFTRVLGGFAALALVLAAFGTYSVIAFLQRRQVRETGVRLALGAAPVDVARRVLAQGATLAVLAGIAGSLAAIAVLRLLAGQLYGVSAASPAIYAAGVGGVLLAALLASLGPALRALRVNPMEALRHE